MYAVAVIRYLKPLEEILPHVEAHRAYLRGLESAGLLLASGPLEPRTGGVLLLRLPDGDPLAGLAEVREGDPFTRLGLASYELLHWKPVIGIERLDAL
jgi:uncharacterized protein YciI